MYKYTYTFKSPLSIPMQLPYSAGIYAELQPRRDRY